LTYHTLLHGGSLPDVWAAVSLPLKAVQSAAVLEVVHAATGLVRSPVAVTATQVASRLWILWGIVAAAPAQTTAERLVILSLPSPAPQLSLSLATLLTAWCLSEVLRYGFFAFKEAGLQPFFMLWLRYSAFIVLYPLGVGSELAMVALALPELRRSGLWSVALPNAANFAFSYWVACLVGTAAYVPGLPHLYRYMLAQRRKVLRGGRPGPRIAKAKLR
jgi:very-long-chain (3R)-3-hydroxyacyl-CoA dehydratase